MFVCVITLYVVQGWADLWQLSIETSSLLFTLTFEGHNLHWINTPYNDSKYDTSYSCGYMYSSLRIKYTYLFNCQSLHSSELQLNTCTYICWLHEFHCTKFHSMVLPKLYTQYCTYTCMCSVYNCTCRYKYRICTVHVSCTGLCFIFAEWRRELWWERSVPRHHGQSDGEAPPLLQAMCVRPTAYWFHLGAVPDCMHPHFHCPTVVSALHCSSIYVKLTKTPSHFDVVKCLYNVWLLSRAVGHCRYMAPVSCVCVN